MLKGKRKATSVMLFSRVMDEAHLTSQVLFSLLCVLSICPNFHFYFFCCLLNEIKVAVLWLL